MEPIKVCRRCGLVYDRHQLIPLKKAKPTFLALMRTVEPEILSCDYPYLISKIEERQKSIEVPGQLRSETTCTVGLRIEYPVCVTCSRKSSGYFEGILQIRNKANRHYDMAIDLVLNLVDTTPSVFIGKVVELKDGIDLFMSDKKFLAKIGKELESRLLASIDKSSSLFSRDRQSGKELHRLTVLARLPEYGIGDIVQKGTTLLHITSMQNGRLIGNELRSHKRTTLSGDVSLVAKAEEIIEARVTKTKPTLEVLHPQSFESTVIANPSEVAGDTVRVVEILGKLYLVQ
jgi:nonsense-mediated mRNA decay protein 3